MSMFRWMKRQVAARVEPPAAAEPKAPPTGAGGRRRRRLAHRSECVTVDETLSLSTTTEEAWRVENVLPSGAPQPGDWWCTEATDGEIVVKKSNPEAETDRNMFRNCGLDAWHLCRSAWKSLKDDDATDARSTASPRSSQSLSKSQRRELIKELLTGRTYQMRQRVNLKDMIQIYNEIWSAEED